MRLVVLGGGGHASDVVSVAESLGHDHESIIVVDEFEPDMTRFENRNVTLVSSFAQAADLAGEQLRFVAGVGYPGPRRTLVARAIEAGWEASAPLSHPLSVWNANVIAAAGAVIMGHTWLSPAVDLGEHVYVGYGAKLGHDSRVGAHTSLLPGCFLGGNTSVGAGCLIGANSTVLPGIDVGDNSQVGAGSVVTKDVPAGATVMGVPAA